MVKPLSSRAVRTRTVKKAEVRRQKAEGVPTNEFGGFNKVATRLFFSINKFRGFKPYGREQRTYFCIKAYLLSFCPLPSALCLSSVSLSSEASEARPVSWDFGNPNLSKAGWGSSFV